VYQDEIVFASPPPHAGELTASSSQNASNAAVLILQGGGAMGAFEAGVVRALEEARIFPDIVAGHSRGGLTSKIHLAVRDLGLPVRCLLIEGQRHDIIKAAELIAGLSADQVMGDTAYDADHFREEVDGARAVIPSNPSRARKLPLERFSTGKGISSNAVSTSSSTFRRIATRYEKTARNFLAMITVAAIALWLR
jgi:predicted acylesterase/phospholipase RssA